MFFNTSNDYLYPTDKPLLDPLGNNAYLPVEIDTEYTHLPYDLNNPSPNISTNITVQVRAISQPTGIIYAHPDIGAVARHKTFKSGFVVVDYLEDLSHDAAISRLKSWDAHTALPWIQIDLYAFFAVAETYRIFQGVYRDDISYLCSQTENRGIDQGRRLRTYHHASGRYFNWVEMPWILSFNGQDYRIRLSIYDTCAVHGNTDYKTFCGNSGIILEHKDNFTHSEKARMLEMYIDRKKEFDEYALGDLYNHDAMLGNLEKFQTIYESLGLIDYFTPPRLTIGATVARIFESGIKKLFNANPSDREHINAFCKHGSADWVKRLHTTGALNAKVDGGRCRNNRPTDTTARGVICDIDISGCYGEGLRIQTYPLGIPLIIDYPLHTNNNEYQTLRQFLKKYSKEFVPGLWQARVSCKEGYLLKYKQDYLISWLPPKDISRMVTDSEFSGTDEWWDIDNVGEIKIFTNEIRHAIITHDFLQWLENVASARQRNELMDNLVVETAMFYSASDRLNSVEELLEAHRTHTGKNTTTASKRKGKTRKVSVQEECHKWYGVNLGEFLVDKLLIERKKHAKKTPFNDLYKLCVNTVYGDMVSPFFTVGNVVVGNNITARARALAWCMEKGLHGWQSITDGCAFDLNQVLYPRGDRKITGEVAVGIYAKKVGDFFNLSPLVGSEFNVNYLDQRISLTVCKNKASIILPTKTESIQLTPDESLNWVNNAAMEHLQKLFPVLDILHDSTTDVYGNERKGQFEFEAKGFYDRATFHGTANYMLSFNGVAKYAMRSYSKRGHKFLELADGLQITAEDIKPSEVFLIALQNPDSVGRSQVFLKERILKVGDYRKNYGKWKDTQVYPGCTVEQPSLLREFSLSQFTFQTSEQYKGWLREYQRFLRRYGQSYEMFFLNERGTLNYQLMVESIDYAIQSGKHYWFDGLDKRAAHQYRQYLKHAQQDCLDETRTMLGKRYHGAVLEDEFNHEGMETSDRSEPYQD